MMPLINTKQIHKRKKQISEMFVQAKSLEQTISLIKKYSRSNFVISVIRGFFPLLLNLFFLNRAETWNLSPIPTFSAWSESSFRNLVSNPKNNKARVHTLMLLTEWPISIELAGGSRRWQQFSFR